MSLLEVMREVAPAVERRIGGMGFLIFHEKWCKFPSSILQSHRAIEPCETHRSTYFRLIFRFDKLPLQHTNPRVPLPTWAYIYIYATPQPQIGNLYCAQFPDEQISCPLAPGERKAFIIVQNHHHHHYHHHYYFCWPWRLDLAFVNLNHHDHHLGHWQTGWRRRSIKSIIQMEGMDGGCPMKDIEWRNRNRYH